MDLTEKNESNESEGSDSQVDGEKDNLLVIDDCEDEPEDEESKSEPKRKKSKKRSAPPTAPKKKRKKPTPTRKVVN